MAEVLRLFVCPAHRLPMKEVDEIMAVENWGLEGCAHGRPGGKRQVLLMDIETLELLGIEPGRVKENVLTRGLELKSLQLGQRLRVGEAMFEVTVPCEPCSRMDEVRPGLQEKLRGRRGILCRVVVGGMIRSGESIEILERAAASV